VFSASEMTYIVSSGALNSTHSTHDRHAPRRPNKHNWYSQVSSAASFVHRCRIAARHRPHPSLQGRHASY